MADTSGKPSAWDQTMRHGMATMASPAARNKVAPPGPGHYKEIPQFPVNGHIPSNVPRAERAEMVPLRPEVYQYRREKDAYKESYLPELKQVQNQAPIWSFKK